MRVITLFAYRSVLNKVRLSLAHLSLRGAVLSSSHPAPETSYKFNANYIFALLHLISLGNPKPLASSSDRKSGTNGQRDTEFSMSRLVMYRLAYIFSHPYHLQQCTLNQQRFEKDPQ